MKKIRVYVASPYEILVRDYGEKYTRKIASKALEQSKLNLSIDFEHYSPVLSLMDEYKDKSRDEVMARCFDELNKCDVLFIPSVQSIVLSDGVKDEFEFAIKKGKMITFASTAVQNVFQRRLLRGVKNEKL
ncbi:hypothetical protein [Campylobacter hyointestinalis]|uniref:hypothetical protein n=1 Tax=Campylobacter hyointestinalis TaxID=198 RepID=UPI00072671A2|nr:hypothetical protein [Campylobacter hyointestinalis]CUU71955.1 Uncharacterised protein [Campylobacter hyointestinalis subsp. hyointestinalis]